MKNVTGGLIALEMLAVWASAAASTWNFADHGAGDTGLGIAPDPQHEIGVGYGIVFADPPPRSCGRSNSPASRAGTRPRSISSTTQRRAISRWSRSSRR